MARNQKLSSHHQPRSVSGLEAPSFTSRILRSLQKRTSRKFWIIICFIISILVLICFPSRTIIYTWRSQAVQSDDGAPLRWSTVSINVKDGQNDWKSDSFEQGIRNFETSYSPKTNYDFRTGVAGPKELEGAGTAAGHGDKPSQVASNLNAHEESKELPIFQRLVVKKPPTEKFESLPSMRPRPSIKYENVTPNLHRLTSELDKTKFLTFLPHSGFHNQRIQVNNAFMLAKLLNRTLILPAFRLGAPQRWANSTVLSKSLEDDMKKYYRLEDCLNSPTKSREHYGGNSIGVHDECEYDSYWTSAQVGYILNIQELTKEIPIIDRIDLREAWLWHTLNLSPGEWLEVQDDSRYSYQIYESAHTELTDNLKYDWRLNIPDLAQFSDARLLSFGSLFGSERIILSSPEMKSWNQKVEKNQLFGLPLLEKISDRMAMELGGRGKYIGLHLRIGNGKFKLEASEIVRNSFDDICRKGLGLDQKLIVDLVHRHESAKQKGSLRKNHKSKVPSQQLQNNNEDPQTLKKFEIPKYKNVNAQYEFRRKEFQPRALEGQIQNRKLKGQDRIDRTTKANLKCGRNFYQNRKNEYLEKLNTPIYISTDVSIESIREDPNLNIIFESFPCVFSFDDLTNLIESKQKKLNRRLNNQKNENLRSNYPSRDRENSKFDFNDGDNKDNFLEEFLLFTQMKTNLDGLKLDRFLFPMLESMIVTKGSHVFGTYGSTFSKYLINVLHPFYSSQNP